MSNSTTHQPSWLFDLIWIGIACTLFFFLLLGARPLLSPDGGRYAEIAREMLALNDFITPHLNNIKYFQKPPLYYWLLALVMHGIDQSFLALRSVNAVVGIVGVLATYGFTRFCYGAPTARLAAAILACNALYFGMVNVVNVDLCVSVFINLSLFAFYLGTRTDFSARQQFVFYVSATVFAALATLTKGLIGFVFPIVIISCWTFFKGEMRQLRVQKFTVVACLLIFLFITLPWHIVIQLQNPEFFQFYVLDQHVQRYLSPSFEHGEPFWYFIPILIIFFFPWSLFLLPTLQKSWRTITQHHVTREINLFLVIQVVFIFIFFSCSRSKLISYILPLIPALSILTAHYLQMHFQRRPRLSYALILATACMLWSALYLFGKYDQRSTLPIARYLQNHAADTDVIVHYHKFYHDLPFYMKQTMTVVEWVNELQFGMQHQDTSRWMINETQFWQQWKSPKRVFAVMERAAFQQLKQTRLPFAPRLLYQDSNKVLISNQG